MAAYFLDTSALAKRYVAEAGTGRVTAVTEPTAGNSCWISCVAPVELLAGLYRRARVGTLTTAEVQAAERVFRHELATHFQVLDWNPPILLDAMRLVAVHPLRAYDALQLAVALDLKAQRSLHGLSAPTFVGSDLILNAAATAEGLAVEDPNQFP